MFCSRCGTEVDDQAKFCASCGFDFSLLTPAGPAEDADHGEITAVREALQGEWDIQEELGRGGMAIVFRARDRHLERDVAIKVLPFSLTFDRQFVERFEREARTAARLEHPHIIPIYRVGKTANVTYFVMKYLRGGSLSDLLERRGRLRVDEIRRLLIETAGALAYAHRSDIVHRDMKPDNIMFDELGNVVVTDFGIAKAASGTRLTGTGMSIGTPHYMSPEQARAQSLDGRSDVYSLGVVAFQCLTGHVPFDGEDSFAIGYKHIMEDVPTPPFHNAEQRSLFAVVERMMAKSPDDRFQSAEELIGALEGRSPVDRRPRATVPEGQPTAAMPASQVPGRRPRSRTMTTTPTTPIPQAQPRPPVKKRSGVLAGMLLLLLIGGGGAGSVWYFLLGAQWPPDFERLLAGGVPPPAIRGAGGDPLDAAGADSVRVAPPDLGAPDTGSRGPSVADLPNTGTFILRNVPGLATVRVDGDVRTTATLNLAAGSHRIEVTMLGHEKFDTTIALARGDTVVLPVSLAPAQGGGPVPVQPTPRPPARLVDVCSEPGADYNADNSCYDVGPSPVRACVLPIPEGVEELPTPVVIWVQVRADSSAGRMQLQRGSSVDAFTRLAGRFARNTRYTPAVKDGRAVDAWLRLACHAVPR